MTHTQILSSPDENTQYFVFSADNEHVGPVSAELIGRGVAAGKVPTDAFVAVAGTSHWVAVTSVPEIVREIDIARRASAAPQTPRPRPPMPTIPPGAVPAAPTAMAPAPGFGALPAAPNATATVLAAPSVARNATTAATATIVIEPVGVEEAPVAAAAPAPALGPAPATAAPAAEPAKADEKKSSALPPSYKVLPIVIFGVFAFIGMAETALTLLLR